MLVEILAVQTCGYNHTAWSGGVPIILKEALEYPGFPYTNGLLCRKGSSDSTRKLPVLHTLNQDVTGALFFCNLVSHEYTTCAILSLIVVATRISFHHRCCAARAYGILCSLLRFCLVSESFHGVVSMSLRTRCG